MSKPRKPKGEQFRPSQVVSPVPSDRRFGAAKSQKRNFDIYISDIETGDETLAITVFAPTQREAIQIAKKRLQSSPVLRKITYVAFTAVEIEG
jgi:replicative superfamily II helicase